VIDAAQVTTSTSVLKPVIPGGKAIVFVLGGPAGRADRTGKGMPVIGMLFLPGIGGRYLSVKSCRFPSRRRKTVPRPRRGLAPFERAGSWEVAALSHEAARAP